MVYCWNHKPMHINHYVGATCKLEASLHTSHWHGHFPIRAFDTPPITSQQMFYGTDHRYMDILHQVILCKQGMLMCIHNVTFDWMCYYTNHRHTDTSHYVYADVCSNKISAGMFFFTHTTWIRTLATMCKLVWQNMRLLTECFITRITGIVTLASMFKLMFLHIGTLTECFLHTSYK